MVENNQKDQNANILVTDKRTGKTTQLQPEMKPRSSKNQQILIPANEFDDQESETHKRNITKDRVDQHPISMSKEVAQKKIKSDKDKKKDIESLEEFIKLFYSGKTKSLPENLARKLNEKISAQPFNLTGLIEDCLKHDSSLEKTKQLLILTLTFKRFPKLERALRDAVRNIILAHPDMIGQSIDNWFPFSGSNQPKDISDIWHDFVSKAESNNTTSAKGTSEKEAKGKKSTSGDSLKSHRNVYVSAMVWRFAERYIKFPELIRELRSTIFDCPTPKEEIELKLLECLAASQDGKERDRIAALIAWFSDLSSTLRNQMEQLRRSVEGLQESIARSRDLIAAKDLEIDKLKSEIVDLRAQLDVAHENARVQGIHLRDDQQKQRGRTLRALEEELPMLQDTLKALERDPPKVTVAKDYLARALDNLNEELKHLRGN